MSKKQKAQELRLRGLGLQSVIDEARYRTNLIQQNLQTTQVGRLPTDTAFKRKSMVPQFAPSKASVPSKKAEPFQQPAPSKQTTPCKEPVPFKDPTPAKEPALSEELATSAATVQQPESDPARGDIAPEKDAETWSKEFPPSYAVPELSMNGAMLLKPLEVLIKMYKAEMSRLHDDVDDDELEVWQLEQQLARKKARLAQKQKLLEAKQQHVEALERRYAGCIELMNDGK